jgi:hypothetical protein
MAILLFSAESIGSPSATTSKVRGIRKIGLSL